MVRAAAGWWAELGCPYKPGKMKNAAGSVAVSLKLVFMQGKNWCRSKIRGRQFRWSWLVYPAAWGAGKTPGAFLSASHCLYSILLAGCCSRQIKLPGQDVLGSLWECGEEVLDIEGRIDQGKMAALIFADRGTVAKVETPNQHPSAVKPYILQSG